jgi:acetyltransferase-like isoleucine patch superfamily enzyme
MNTREASAFGMTAEQFGDYSALVGMAGGAVTAHAAADLIAVPLDVPGDFSGVCIEGRFAAGSVMYLHRGASAKLRVISRKPDFTLDGVKIVVGRLQGSVDFVVGGSDAVAVIGDCGAPFELRARCGPSSRLVVGDKTTIGKAEVMVGRSDLKIGRDCLLSTGISLISAQDHGIVDLSGDDPELQVTTASIEIGDHVWLGYNSHCVGNARIGDGAILAAHAVLSGELPGNTIGGGNPARVIRTDRTWSRLYKEIDADTQDYLAAATAQVAATRENAMTGKVFK